MQSNVIDIILYLVRQLQVGKKLKDIDLKSLKSYSNAEIGAAYSWIYQKHENGELDHVFQGHYTHEESSHRVLHMAERMIIDPHAYGYLLELLNAGLITQHQMEHIIEKSLLGNAERITLDRIKSIVSGYITKSEPGSILHSFYLKGNETIN